MGSSNTDSGRGDIIILINQDMNNPEHFGLPGNGFNFGESLESLPKTTELKDQLESLPELECPPSFIKGATVFLSDRPDYPLEDTCQLGSTLRNMTSTNHNCVVKRLQYGTLGVFQDMCSRAKFPTPQLNRILSSQLLYNGCLETIINYYSDPKSDAVTLGEADALLQLVALGGGVGRWLSAFSPATEVYRELKSYGGAYIYTMQKKDLLRCDLTSKGFYERPPALFSLFRELNDGHKAICSANAHIVDTFQEENNAELYVAQSMAVGAILFSVMYHVTMRQAHIWHNKHCEVSYIQPNGMLVKDLIKKKDGLSTLVPLFPANVPGYSFLAFVDDYLVPSKVIMGVRKSFALFDESKSKKQKTSAV